VLCALNQEKLFQKLVEDLSELSKKKVYKEIKNKIYDFRIEGYQKVTFYFPISTSSKKYAYKDYQYDGAVKAVDVIVKSKKLICNRFVID